MKKLKKILRKQGFTIVELIVVIAIIAVLAVAAFMILTKWLSHSRDSRRLADLDTAHKSIEIWLVDLDNTSYVAPLPDKKREVSMNGTIWYQGVIGTGVVESIDSLTKQPIDPNDREYVYSLLKSNKRIYQIATILENPPTSMVNGAYASEVVNKVEGSFEPALYKTNKNDGDCGMVYLPSIVVANGITNIEPSEGTQYFVLDGESNNLLYDGTVMKNYKDIVSVDKDIDMVWSGSCSTDFDDAILTNIVNNLEGMIPVDGGGSVTKTLVSELIDRGSGINIEATSSTIPSGPIPINTANGIYVSNDTDINTNQFSGTVTITPSIDESDITHYVIYWADNSNSKISGAITTISKGGIMSYNIPENTNIPSGAENIIVFTKNENGEMNTGVSTSFTDNTSGGIAGEEAEGYFTTPTLSSFIPSYWAGNSYLAVKNVDISGEYATAGAWGTNNQEGTAYIYKRQADGSWNELQSLTPTSSIINVSCYPSTNCGARYGIDTAIDGNYAVVSANRESSELQTAGALYVFEKQGNGTWVEIQKLTATTAENDDRLGSAHSLDIEGNYIVAGSLTNGDNGAVFIWERQGDGTWTEIQKLSPTPALSTIGFGYSVGIYGDYIMASTTTLLDKSIYVFKKQGDGTWSQIQKITGIEGIGINLDIDGDYMVAGGASSDDAGAANVFKKEADGTWSQIQKFTPENGEYLDSFGDEVGISGNYITIGARRGGTDNAGDIYIYEKQADGSWSQIQKIHGDGLLSFGGSMAMDGDTIFTSSRPYGKLYFIK